MTQLVLPPEFSQRLLRSSVLAGVSVYYAFTLGHTFFVISGWLMLITSINYWRHPVVGWRRSIDMAVAFFCLITHMLWSLHLPLYAGLMYAALVSLGLGCYYNARVHGKQKKLDVSSKYHMGLHVFANLSNLVLYWGLASIDVIAVI